MIIEHPTDVSKHSIIALVDDAVILYLWTGEYINKYYACPAKVNSLFDINWDFSDCLSAYNKVSFFSSLKEIWNKCDTDYCPVHEFDDSEPFKKKVQKLMVKALLKEKNVCQND